MVHDDPTRAALRAWLLNERRLGVRHYGIPVPKPTATARSGDSAASVGSAAAGIAGFLPVAERGRAADQLRVCDAVGAALPGDVRPRGAAASMPTMISVDASGLLPLCDRELTVEEARAALEQLDAGFVRGCKKCGLHAQRTQTVFGVGNPRAELVFVGEGPGADEDAQGVPFVGKAGQLLTRMIQAMTLTREQVHICNVVKCRPPGNRTPEEVEIEACSPYLYRQLAILRPKVIVTLGRPATQTLLATKAAIGALRGQWHDFPPPALGHVGLPACRLMPTFHPAYLLRSPGEKGKAWSDLKQVMEFFGIPIPGGA